MSFESKIKELAWERVRMHEPLSRHTTFRIGGPADYYVMPERMSELEGVVKVCREYGMPYQVIGNGSNLLCADEGFRGVLIDTSFGLNRCRIEGNMLRAEAGVLLGALAKKAMTAGLTGLEFAAGIPGTAGGALVMNAGAYGGEIKQVVRWARVLTKEGEIKTVSAEELALSYRRSSVRSNGWIVLEAGFELAPGEPEEIQATMNALAVKRREKQPLEYPSAGSTFKRPEGYFAAQLIDEAGLKGFTVGGAQVSEKHAGFVINRGNATASDVLTLCQTVRDRIRQNTGVTLELEVEVIGICHFPPM